MGAISRGLKESGNVLLKGGKKKKALNQSLSLSQMEFGAGEQVEVFTPSVWVSAVNEDCPSFLGWLATKVPGLLMCPDVAGVGKEDCGEWVSDKARWSYQGLHLEGLVSESMENGSHHILGPQIGAKRREEALQLGRHHCKREQRGKHNDTTLWSM